MTKYKNFVIIYIEQKRGRINMTVLELNNKYVKEIKEIFLKNHVKENTAYERKSMTVSELSREVYRLQCQENLRRLLGV